MKVEPLQENVPRSLLTDVESEAYFTRLHRFLRDMWTRTGGGSDFIEDNNAQSLLAAFTSNTGSIGDLEGFHRGIGVPAAGLGREGDFYFRRDGTAGAVIYHKESGTWTALA